MDSCASAMAAGIKILLSFLFSLLLLIATSVVDCLVVAFCNTIASSVIDAFVWSNIVAASVDADSIDELLRCSAVGAFIDKVVTVENFVSSF